LSFPYLIVAPLAAERHHPVLQVAPLTAERHVPVLQVAPLTAERLVPAELVLLSLLMVLIVGKY